jgi:hypothetical protein
MSRNTVIVITISSIRTTCTLFSPHFFACAVKNVNFNALQNYHMYFFLISDLIPLFVSMMLIYDEVISPVPCMML